ncbi:hypothetical protein DSO57_1016923 [Entomophthora muscae]|uniref:Uncharacterized protein n=1 Tax=Entomophthora muscae TaxID=34485 RepID=A0ACC2STG4_9FUNG|nr:hypothetical protein DSO57_1016923 [Entomophthora muscae]
MLTQPRHFCYCFSLRTGTLILAFFDLLITFIVLLGLSVWNESGLSSGIKCGSIVVCALFVLVNTWLLYGAIKYDIVKYFSAYIAVQIFFYTLQQIGIVVKYTTSTKTICLSVINTGCRYGIGTFIASMIISTTITYLLSVSPYLS